MFDRKMIFNKGRSYRRRKDILILCQYFYPEKNSSATLPYDTARFFAECGYKTGVVCGYPKEYSDWDNVPVQENVDGIFIRRLPYIQSKRIGKIGRLVNYFSFTTSVFFHLGLFRDYRCIICYSNPPILPDAVLMAARLYKTKLIFVVYDVYPEVAYASGNIHRGSLIDCNMRRINHGSYKSADRVIVLSDEMKDFILLHRPEISEDRVSVIHNWAHEENDEVKDRIPDSGARCTGEWGSINKQSEENPGNFRVSYFGNMGICQDIATMLQAARETAEDEGILFEFVGHGNKKEKIEHFIASHHLQNISVMGYMTGQKLRARLSASSCCVVSLKKGLKGMCAPSKYYTYLFMGKPIISVMENDSYISREIRKEKIGFAVSVGDVEGFKKAVLYMRDHPLEASEMGRRARDLYIRKYKYHIAMSKYRDVIDSVLERGVQ